jgi:hypothetical protein
MRDTLSSPEQWALPFQAVPKALAVDAGRSPKWPPDIPDTTTIPEQRARLRDVWTLSASARFSGRLSCTRAIQGNME